MFTCMLIPLGIHCRDVLQCLIIYLFFLVLSFSFPVLLSTARASFFIITAMFMFTYFFTLEYSVSIVPFLLLTSLLLWFSSWFHFHVSLFISAVLPYLYNLYIALYYCLICCFNYHSYSSLSPGHFFFLIHSSHHSFFFQTLSLLYLHCILH